MSRAQADWLAVAGMLRALASDGKTTCVTFCGLGLGLATLLAPILLPLAVHSGDGTFGLGVYFWVPAAAAALAGGLLGMPLWSFLLAMQAASVRSGMQGYGLAERMVTEQRDRWLSWYGDRPGLTYISSRGKVARLNSLARTYESLARGCGAPGFAAAGCYLALSILILVCLLLFFIYGAAETNGLADTAMGIAICSGSAGMLLVIAQAVVIASANAAVALALAEAIEDGSAFASWQNEQPAAAARISDPPSSL